MVQSCCSIRYFPAFNNLNYAPTLINADLCCRLWHGSQNASTGSKLGLAADFSGRFGPIKAAKPVRNRHWQEPWSPVQPKASQQPSCAHPPVCVVCVCVLFSFYSVQVNTQPFLTHTLSLTQLSHSHSSRTALSHLHSSLSLTRSLTHSALSHAHSLIHTALSHTRSLTRTLSHSHSSLAQPSLTHALSLTQLYLTLAVSLLQLPLTLALSVARSLTHPRLQALQQRWTVSIRNLVWVLINR